MCSLGRSKITTHYEKDVYTSNEIAHAIISVDNSNCKGKISNIIMTLKQKVTLDTGHHQYRRSYNVLERSFGSVDANTTKENMLCELNLSLAKQHYVDNFAHYDDMKKPNKNMISFAETLQPTTSGKCISISYELCTKLEFEGTCCIDNPDCTMDMFLQPAFMPGYGSVKAPANWNPKNYDNVVVKMPDSTYAPVEAKAHKH